LPGALLYPNLRQPLRKLHILFVYNIERLSPDISVSPMATANPFPAAEHDHDDCMQHALQTAESICLERGLRLTSTRQRVLELIWKSHKPIGAYDLLEELRDDGRRAAPPTVYRALEFLIEAGLVHRLDSLNAFVGCPEPHSAHAGQFLICRQCRSVAELADNEIETIVSEKAAQLGFSAIRQMLEIEGLCPDCSKGQLS
jgi:Fur family zinc uptake transcriptional regulator